MLSAKRTSRAIHLKVMPYPGMKIPGYGALVLDVSFALDEDGPGMTLSLDGPPDYPMEELALPGPFRLDMNAGQAGDWRFVLPIGEGLALPADRQTPFLGRVNFWDSPLPAAALMQQPFKTGAALLLVACQGHDHAALPLIAENGQGPGFNLSQMATLGRWGYRRSWRVIYIPHGGLSALAAKIRQEINRMGVAIPTLQEKLSQSGVPANLHGSVGGTHLWWHSSKIPVRLIRNLYAAGLKSVVLLGRVADGSDTAAKAAAAGYIIAPYFQTYDVFQPGFGKELEWRGVYPPEGATHGWPAQLIRDMQGWYEKAWTHMPCRHAEPHWRMKPFLAATGDMQQRAIATHHEHITSTQRRCPVFHADLFRRYASPMLKRSGYTGVFCDILTAMPGRECYSEEHPCDRRRDVQERRKVFAEGLKSHHLFLSEGGRWWALDLAHGFEGVLSFGEGNINNNTLTDYPFDPAWYDTQFNLDIRVPLFSMVARHSVTQTLWWGHGQDRHAQSWDAKNALCALFGGNPIYIADSTHLMEPGTPKWNRFVAGCRAFDTLRAATWGAELTQYETLCKHVAISTFANGVSVKANIGPVAAEGLAPGSFSICPESN